MGSTPEDILKGPDYFKCERFKTTLSKLSCLKRQEGPIEDEPFHSNFELDLSLEYCKDCEQGKKIGDELIKQSKPNRGKGERKEDCPLYSRCLDHVVKKTWGSFNCEQCSIGHGGEAMTEKPENTRICKMEGCGKITLSANCPYCPSCMAKRTNKKSEAREQGQAAKKGKGQPPFYGQARKNAAWGKFERDYRFREIRAYPERY